jgi:hypothetical protein
MLFRSGRLLLRHENVILLVCSQYPKLQEPVKSRDASSKYICILGEINSEISLWNRSRYVNLSAGSERFLFLTSSEWKTIDKRS